MPPTTHYGVILKIETSFTYFYLKMFQLVEPSELIPGHKYKISGWKDSNPYTYKEREILPLRDVFLFEDSSGYLCCSCFLRGETSLFYKFISQKARIQSDMERRAVNLILRNLIGDGCFTW